ncbi:MAG: peptidoglycan-binding protein [Acidimicrobiales bacterium]|nr:peptidoglycan-binding protein [Acidimicrobiales bacterium]
MKRRSVLLVVAAVAVIAATAGWVAGRTIRSPASAAANAAAPAPSRITVPVERRALSQNVVVRGDVELADSVQVKVDAAIAGGGPAIVTAAPVAEGSALVEGTLLLEVAERPVVLLAGELPMFRTLSLGSRGDDVAQFEASLARLGFDPGPQDALFDAGTEAAVRAWYTQLGYAPVGPTTAEAQRLRDAQDAVDAAQKALSDVGIAESERLQLLGAIDDAIAAAAQARATGAPEAEIARLDRQITIAEASYAERTTVDASAQQQTLDAALAELARVRNETGVKVPAAEVVFVKTMPRKLDRLGVSRGDAIGTNPVAEISSATVRIRSAVAAEDRPLLAAGDRVRVEEEGLGIDLGGTIIELADKTGGTGVPAGKYSMIVEPDTFDPAQLGINVKLTAAVQATEGEVLAVPLAALFATADGSAQVEVEDAPDQPPRGGTVRTGLSADGFVEVGALEGDLEAGDRVVVGRDQPAGGASAGEGSAGPDEADESADG